MKDSKLLEILNILTVEESQELAAFLDFSLLRTTYDVADDDIKKLWQVIRTLKSNFNDTELDPNLVYKMVFPQKNFVKGRLEKTMSALLKEIEKMIAYRFYTEGGLFASDESFAKQYPLLQFYAQRQLNHRFERSVEKLKEDCEKNTYKDQNSLLKSYLVEVADNAYESLYNIQKGDANLRATIDSLDIFYVVARLSYLADVIAQRRKIGFDISAQLSLLIDIESIINKKNWKKVPIIETYEQAIKLLLDEDNFSIFQETLNRNEQYFTLTQRQTFRAIERNKCVDFFNSGQKEYIFTLAKLLEQHLDAGYLYYQSGLIPSTLLNLTSVAVKVKNLDWLKKVLDTHKNRIISTDDSEQVFSFNYAVYHFAKGEYKAAFEQISSDYKFKDAYYDLSKRRLEIKIFYEQKEFDLCAARNEAFKNYLFTRTKKKKEDNFPATTFEPNNNFVNFMSTLLNLSKNDKHKIKLFHEKLLETPAIAEYEWFLEKITALLPK
ncbi:MAG: hypothetical protein JNL70_15080 [Saprospiraceae bacterium]|nr:hypothetical protein [Saprospiraceae bacterium]